MNICYKKSLAIFSILFVSCLTVQIASSSPNFSGIALSQLFEKINTLIPKVVANPANEPASKELIESYNAVRKMLDRAPIKNVSEIEAQWLADVKKEVPYYKVIEQAQAQLPLPSHKVLLEKVAKSLGLEKKLKALSSQVTDTASTIRDSYGNYLIALCRTPSKYDRLAALYHEISHVINNDPDNIMLISRGQKKPEDFLGQPDFIANSKTINRYKDLAKKSLNQSSVTGKRALEVLGQYNSFWDEPKNSQVYNRIRYERFTEERADLFEAEKLVEKKLVDVLINHIIAYLTSSYIVAHGDQDNHPSDFERGLYMAGFLVDKGEDINSLLKKWENEGMCIPSGENEILSETSIEGMTEGARDLFFAYRRAYEAEQGERYKQWKLKANDIWNQRKGNREEKVQYFLNFFKEAQERIGEDPANLYYEDQLLFTNNFIREKYNMTPAASLQAIDRAWIATLSR
jgi:hypothetical protein